VKHTEQRGIWVPTQHLLWDQGKPTYGPSRPVAGIVLRFYLMENRSE
jgi:hypothetical protein